MTTEQSTRSSASPGRARRRVAAPLSRIVLAGASSSAMFGMVAVMAAASDESGTVLAPAPSTATGAPDGASVVAPRSIIVIEHLPADAATTSGAPVTAPPAAPPTTSAAVITMPQPAVTSAPAPMTRTKRS